MKKSNAFVKALYSDRYKEVLDYIVFAKKISDLNAWSGDPWERDRNSGNSLRSKQIAKAVQSAGKAKDDNLKRRYAYLAVRLAFYNNDYEQIKKLYGNYFEGQTPDVVLYWAMHFKVSAEASSARRNVETALVFTHSHEKRFPVHFMYDFEIDRETTLKACKNDAEKSAVDFFLTSRKVDRALPQIKNFASGTKDENLLCFLLLRETNKLEDWILTPYYSEFQPSLNQEWYEKKEDYFSFKKRINDDRKYAAELAAWAGKQEISESSKKAWWKTMTAYLHFLAGGEHLEVAEKMLVKQSADPALLRFNNMLSALITAEQNVKPDLENAQLQQLVRSESELANDKFCLL